MSSTGPATSQRLAVAVLCAVQFVDVLGVTSVITAIPAILAGLAAPPEATGLLATGYAMFFGGLLVLGARLGDRYGHRRVLLLGIMLFAAVALVGATAGGIGQVLVARALQGTAAAISVPCALRLLLHATPDPDARRGAVAWWSASGAVAGVLGYLIGGALTAAAGWRAVFWINAPIGVFLLAGVIMFVPVLIPQERRTRLDLAGAGLLIAAVMAVIVGCSLLESPQLRPTGVLVIVAGLAIAALFVVQQRRAAEPLIPRAAAASEPLRVGTAVSFVNTATTSSAGVLATLLLQQQLGVSALQAGLLLMPLSVAVVVGSLLTRPLGRRLSPARLAGLGLGGIALGNALLALTVGTLGGVVAGAVAVGAGLGIASVAATTIGTDVPEELSGSATGLLNTGAQLGTAIGVAALVTVAASVSGRAGTALAWSLAAAAAAVTGVVMFRRSRRTPSEAEP